MPTVRELQPGEEHRAARVLLELRPGSPESLVREVGERLRPAGYRFVASFEDDEQQAAAVAGFRVGESLAWGRHLYVDDLVTAAERRGRGHAERLFAWLLEEARRLGCEQLHLDSGVDPDRRDAHRFYMRHDMAITAVHFARQV